MRHSGKDMGNQESYIWADYEEGETPADWDRILISHAESEGKKPIEPPVLREPKFCPVRGIVVQSSFVKVKAGL